MGPERLSGPVCPGVVCPATAVWPIVGVFLAGVVAGGLRVAALASLQVVVLAPRQRAPHRMTSLDGPKRQIVWTCSRTPASVGT